MKIKHFAGYGSVEAFKIYKKSVTDKFGEKKTQLAVKVKGNHEWGLERDDTYTLYHWLIKRFDKSVGDYYRLNIEYTKNDYYVEENNLDVECCDYVFTY